MSNARFHPWVGPSYGEHGRVLILGESHYDEERLAETKPVGSEQDTTIWLTKQYLEGVRKHRFWPKSARLAAFFCDWKLGDQYIDSHEAINRIAIYNFANAFLIDKRSAPSTACVRESRLRLVETLDEIRPEIVFALGLGRQPWFLSDIAEFSYLSTGKDAFAVKYKQTSILNCCHPSGRFSYATALTQLRAGHKLLENSK